MLYVREVGKYGRVIPTKGFDFMICLLARFRGVESHCELALLSKAGYSRHK
jgi:hypothetical protein